MLVALMFVLPMIGSVLAAHSNIILAHIGLQIRNILVNKIYRKALLLSPAARQITSTGQIVNMFSGDTVQLQRFMFFVNNIFMALPTIAIALFLIYRLVGLATFVGLGMIVLTTPLNAIVFNALNVFRKERMLVTDYRVKLMNEILAGIRVIKFYAWEHAFADKITSIRLKELEILRKAAYLMAFAFTMILQAIPIFMPVLIFYTYVKLGHTLDAAKAFTAISLFNLMQFPFVFLPLGLSQYSQATVSIKRLLQFFAADELNAYVSREPSDYAISLKDVRLGWVQEKELQNMDMLRGKADDSKYAQIAQQADAKQDADAEAGAIPETVPINRSIETLRNISLSIAKGELVAIVGPVGCGKSSFLSGILGELHLLSGAVSVDGSIAYCDQRPWILNDSVQGNILFGQEMQEQLFDEALYAACLEDDIKVLPGGLQTQIGEKGINLSGGQKARVALARAVYKNADIYLLDDPLSAVDAHVAHFLFYECICRTLAGKTRLLVTHHVHLLPHCDKVIVLVDGQVKASGSYTDILASGIDLSTLASNGQAPLNAPTESAPAAVAVAVDEIKPEVAAETAKPKDDRQFDEIRRIASVSAALRKQDSRSTVLMSKEERQEGDVSWSCYVYYIRSGGVGLFSLFMLSVLINQVFTLLGAYWLQYWGSEAAKREDNGDSLDSNQNVWYLNIYAALAGVSLLFYMFRSLLLAEHRLGTSVRLHEGLLRGTLNAPVTFFDTTPLGRILNRFSADLNTIDEELSQSISQVSNGASNVIGAVGAIAGATKGSFLILMIPLSYFYYLIQKYFRATNTAIARVESVSRSPIYADFAQALTGMTTVRAYHEQQRFILQLESAVNANSIANITQQLSSQWLAVRLDLIGGLISFFIAAIAAATTDFLPAGFVALGLAYSFQMTTYLKFLVRMVATAEAQMNSVERVLHYMNHIDQEQSIVPGNQAIIPPASWPEQGIIEVSNLQMRYRDGPLVLKAVDFTTSSCEKIGIAGRTGSGKSSLMIALFRIEEVAGGQITIDGIDTARIPLHVLRSRLGIIPQDPIMFSASVRFNLDPFDQYTDEAIWDMLDRVNMKDHVLSLPGKLQETVAEGGDNFSVGQRQLICIGRAVLRKPKILVLDEATASIDNENDLAIQQMVRTQFQQCTVLTIAHRLHTIIDSDR